MATLSDFNGQASFTIGGNSFNNRATSGTPIYERTGGDGGSTGNSLGVNMHAWGRFWWSSQGYNPQFYLRHSKNIKYQHIADGTSGHPHGSGQWYWVLEEPIDSAIVTGGAGGNYKTNNAIQALLCRSYDVSTWGRR